jgi:hypothetical protein
MIAAEPPCGYPRWILSSFQGRYTRPSLSQTVPIFNESRRSRFLGRDELSHLWSKKETKFSPSHVFETTYKLVRDIAERTLPLWRSYLAPDGKCQLWPGRTDRWLNAKFGIE